jgi:hypothetical protein
LLLWDASGHTSVLVTSVFLQVAFEDDGRAENLFEFK